MFYFDPMYLIFALPALILAFFAQYKVQSTYAKYSRVRNTRGLTGLDAARWLLGSSGLSHVSVEGARGRLSDHYDPRKKVLRLSGEVAYSQSVAALGIVAHEVGHALQDQTNYAFLRLRTGLVPVVNLGSYLGFILFFIGILLQFSGLIWLGIIFFSGSVVFAFLTLPVEWDASRRALQMLRAGGLVDSSELKGAQAVLSAASLTYVAALAQAISSLLYYIFIALGMRRRD
ncbi:MAG TPA: zinc metallopeptidase [Chloroflexi bacterium]|nr:zinc metallopeptidase [Chloroflexota bacterium]